MDLIASALPAASTQHRPGHLPIGFIFTHHVEHHGRFISSITRIVHDPTRAPLVLKAFELVGHEHQSLHAAHRQVVSDGLTNTKGEPIYVMTLYHMLKNPFYMGLVRFGGELLKGDYPPLVSRELFDAVQESLHRRCYRALRAPSGAHGTYLVRTSMSI